MHTIDATLAEVYTIVEEYTKNKKPEYNIFKVLEIEEKEVLMCRVLTDFLNPEGLHKKGSKYLKLFLSAILQRKDAEKIAATAHVFKEYPIPKDRRIDIVILSEDRWIPIEVKIHAGAQKSQCYDYYTFAREKDKSAKVVYLTKWGTMPESRSMVSEDGKSSLEEKDIVCISFAEDICRFMDILIEQETDIVIKEIAQQYKAAIQSFTVVVDDELRKQVAAGLIATENNFRAMLAIEQSAKKAKADLIYKVLEEMAVYLKPLAEKYGFEKDTRFSWYEYQEEATEAFYKQKESTYPGINYVVKNVLLPDGIELWFRVEIDYNLFAGLCLFDTRAEMEWGKGSQLNEPDETVKKELSQYISLENAVYDAWWVQWWYLPTATDNKRMDSDKIPDFKNMNEAAVCLADSKKRRKFIEEAIKAIDKRLSELILKQSSQR